MRYPKVFIYRQYCLRDGQRAYPSDDRQDSEDYLSFAGSRRSLLRAARIWERAAKSEGNNANGAYSARVARTLRDAAEEA